MGDMSWLQTRRTPLLVLSVSIVVVLLSIWAFHTSDGSVKARAREERLEAALAAGAGDLGPTLEVRIEVAHSAPSIEIIELAGVLEPIRRAWIAAEIAGRILEVPAKEYAPIARGDVLVQIDSSLPRAELIRAEARHLLAKAELDRQTRLGSRSVASEAELDRAKSEERSAWAAVLEARTRLGYTRITAPFDGLVNSLDLDPGAYVQPGTRLAEVLDLSVIEVTVLVSDRQVHALHPGAVTSVRVDTLGSLPFEGRIARVGGAPVSGGQRYPVVISVDPTIVPLAASASDDSGAPPPDDSSSDSPRRLLPGMLAQVRFEVGSASAIRLPSRSILHEFELDYVFVLDEQDAARRARVDTRPVPFRPDQVEIVSGLNEGDRVVVTAVDQLRNGLRVIVR